MTIEIPEESKKVLMWSLANRLDTTFECVMDDYKRSGAKESILEFGREEFLPLYKLYHAVQDQLQWGSETLYSEEDFQKALDLLQGNVDEDFMEFLKETYLPYDGDYDDLVSDIAIARRDWLQDYEGDEYTTALNRLKATTKLFLRQNSAQLPQK